MALLCVARRLLLSLSSIVFMFLCVSFLITSCKMVLVYDHQTLMDIRVAVETARCDICVPRTSSLPTHSYLPLHHCWHLADLPWKRKRRRKRGKRGGVAVQLRSFAWTPSPLSDRPGLACERGACWSRLDASYRWLRPVVPSVLSMSSRHPPPRVRCRGVNTLNLRSLNRTTQFQEALSVYKVALINVCSLVNKTFLLNYFFYFTCYGYTMHHGNLD